MSRPAGGGFEGVNGLAGNCTSHSQLSPMPKRARSSLNGPLSPFPYSSLGGPVLAAAAAAGRRTAGVSALAHAADCCWRSWHRPQRERERVSRTRSRTDVTSDQAQRHHDFRSTGNICIRTGPDGEYCVETVDIKKPASGQTSQRRYQISVCPMSNMCAVLPADQVVDGVASVGYTNFAGGPVVARPLSAVMTGGQENSQFGWP